MVGLIFDQFVRALWRQKSEKFGRDFTRKQIESIPVEISSKLDKQEQNLWYDWARGVLSISILNN